MQHYLPKLSRIKKLQDIQVSYYHKYKNVIEKMYTFKTTNIDALIDPKVKNVKNKLLYSDYLNQNSLRFGYNQNAKIRNKMEKKFKKEALQNEPLPTSIALKYLDDLKEDLLKQEDAEDRHEDLKENEKPIHMPYADTHDYKQASTKKFEHADDQPLPQLNEKFKALYEKYLEIRKRESVVGFEDVVNNPIQLRLEDDASKVPSSWMTDYEIYDDALQENLTDVKYGTPNLDSEVSAIPCGGCGALLHCKDASIPGYLPSELFIGKSDEDLRSITCQRCHFMKNYNTCLDVRVSAEEYPKLLEEIKNNRRAIVILLVDLTDFPCSIWPDIPSLVGKNRHIYVVGNKIDLLPPDAPNFLIHVKDCLMESLISTGVTKSNIKHVGLISAKTGFGIDELINKLHKVWQYRSDVYLVGCTNTGKSTLFNAFLNSDFCKSQAVDLIQRATTSPWPGTTLNLLKFPILKPHKYKLYLRTLRLKEKRRYDHADYEARLQEYKDTRKIELATLQSTITHTFKEDYELSQAMHQSRNSDIISFEKEKKFGLDETAHDYVNSRWCYDTPGTIQPDQILHFLTTDELMQTLPDGIISPRTFLLKPSQSIFIAGLGRLDILDVPTIVRCTVFASRHLPITICKAEDADLVYNELLQTEAFRVPVHDPDRLKMWPQLKPKDLETVGVGHVESVSDVVLSSAGWIAITADENETVRMKAWTPEGCGIHLRTPALLPKSVKLRGMRKIKSPAYHLGKQVHVRKHI